MIRVRIMLTDYGRTLPGMDVYTVVGAGEMLSGHWSPPHISYATCIRFSIIHVRSVGFGNRRQ